MEDVLRLGQVASTAFGHMTGDLSKLIQLSSIHPHMPVEVANGRVAYATAKGH